MIRRIVIEGDGKRVARQARKYPARVDVYAGRFVDYGDRLTVEVRRDGTFTVTHRRIADGPRGVDHVLAEGHLVEKDA